MNKRGHLTAKPIECPIRMEDAVGTGMNLEQLERLSNG